MCAKITNDFRITGVIHKKDVIQIQGKKDPSKVYPKTYLILETEYMKEWNFTQGDGDSRYKSKDMPTYASFEIFNGDLEAFSQGDVVEVKFHLEGTFSKDGTRLWDKHIIDFVKHADIDAGHSNHKGKITVTPDVEKEELFGGDDEGLSDLPFVILALVGLCGLLPNLPI